MDHGFMHGMFWAGLLMMSIPVGLGLGIAGYVLYRYWTDRQPGSSPRARS